MFCDDIEEKREFFTVQETILTSFDIFVSWLSKCAKFTVKTTTELVKLYSLNSEKKEHHTSRVKMLAKIIMAISFSVYSVGGKSTYSN